MCAERRKNNPTLRNMNEHKARCKRKQGNDLQLPCYCHYCKVNLEPHIAYIPQPLFRVYATKHACSIFIKIKSIIKFFLHARTNQARKRRQQLRSRSQSRSHSRTQYQFPIPVLSSSSGPPSTQRSAAHMLGICLLWQQKNWKWDTLLHTACTCHGSQEGLGATGLLCGQWSSST